jgi:transcriptional regulator with XRE-family HTH domain
MDEISGVGRLIQKARTDADMSQAELAERSGSSQSAVARLEHGDSNPTVATLVRCAAAAGYAIKVRLEPLPFADLVVARYKRDVDRTLIRENLRRSVTDRLRSLGEWQESLETLQRATRLASARR